MSLFCVGGAPFSCHSGESYQTRCLFPHFRKNGGAGKFRDVVGHGKSSESSGSFCVHTPFRYHFTIEMSDFLKIPRVLSGKRTAQSGGLNILVVGDRAAIFCGKSFLVHTITVCVMN